MERRGGAAVLAEDGCMTSLRETLESHENGGRKFTNRCG